MKNSIFEEFFEGFYENKNLLLLLSSCDSNGFTLDGRSVISIKTRIETKLIGTYPEGVER